MRPKSHITVPPAPEHPNRKFMVFYQPNTEHSFKVHVHNNCRCNEYIALRNRVLMEVPRAEPTTLAYCRTLARLISDWLPRHTKADGEWIEAYSGKKKRKYLRAQQSLTVQPIRRADSYVSAFIKPEKIELLKDPRMIQARGARYNYALANYLKPIEHALYNLSGTGRLKKWLPPGRLIAKGLCQRRRAALMRKKWERFKRPVCISLDASRFDAHVTDMLAIEHLIYKRYYKDPYLDRLLAWQVKNRGFTHTGLRYRCEAGRMSGDMNTALGNCVISIIMIAVIMHRARIRHWDVLCDGDDVLLFVEDGQPLPDLRTEYLKFGFDIKIENEARDFYEVKFCQSGPCETADGLKMVAIPRRVLARTLVGTKHWNEPKFVQKYLSLIGYCELALNQGVPVLQDFALMILSWGKGFPDKWLQSGRILKALREERSIREVHPRPISIDARLSFERAFGISVLEQRVLEAVFSQLSNWHATKEVASQIEGPAASPSAKGCNCWFCKQVKPQQGYLQALARSG
nr:MAG: RNA-dependent RNA polymerase [Riboviria sp.]